MGWFSRSTVEVNESDQRLQELVHKERMAGFKLQESIYNCMSNIVDPCEDLIDPESGERWQLCGSGSDSDKQNGMGERWYTNMRGIGRTLVLHNPWAQNIQDNRVSYIVGSGHRYDITPNDPKDASSVKASDEMTMAFDTFREDNEWGARQQNNQERLDRDGVVFTRITKKNGTISLRYIEPEHIKTPEAYSNDKNVRYGIRYSPTDAGTVEGYYVYTSEKTYELVDADEIQQRNRGVDLNDPLGISLYYSIAKNLTRAEKLLRNKSVLIELQTAIGMIRKHGGNSSEIERWSKSNATANVTNSATGTTHNIKRYAPGTTLDASKDTEYEFPAQGLNVANYDGVSQEELRAAASRVIMPEYMVTADASNSAYASTLVAEGPAVKNFEKQQAQMMAWDMKLFDMLFQFKVDEGVLSEDDKELVNFAITPPRTQVRDRKADTEADEILVQNQAMSIQTMSERANLDPEEEAKRILARSDAELNLPPDDDSFGN